MKWSIILIALSILIFHSCSEETGKNESNVVINSYLINGSDQLVYCIRNDSRNRIVLLSANNELLPKVYWKNENDSIWLNITGVFYQSITPPPDKPEILKPLHDELVLYEPKKDKPETTRFYNMVLDSIKNSSLNMKTSVIEEFSLIINNSIFLKPDESYFDTILLSPFRGKYPDKDLKFKISFPGVYMYKTEISYLDFFVKSILQDSLGISLPQELDGYKVFHNMLFEHERIIKAGDE